MDSVRLRASAEIRQPNTAGGDMMKLSARNQFQGTVIKITEGQAMAEVVVKVGALEFVAAITEGSVKEYGAEGR